MEREEPINIYEAWNSGQAHFVRHMLADAGIRARVASDMVEAVHGRVPYQLTTCPVWVAAADVHEALRIIEQYEDRLVARSRGEPVPVGPFCYHCGEPQKSGENKE